jgi:pyruvate/2-oxoglutarate/acetoin dehydrogenase E1 component/TPP-dependent pyruvate/acetoin dehydrogenase alpha subunit
MKSITEKKSISFEDFKIEVLNDYKIAVTSRECSLLGRKEVLTGKAKFGIFGDGKEVPQLAMAKEFKNGDFRSGYYRDQTFMMALDLLSPQQFFAGLYGHPDINAEPMSAGRQMGGHFATHSIDEDGNWNNLLKQKNSSSDISPTAGQMPRLLGLAQASKIYKNVKEIPADNNFSNQGNEVAWGTIGNASTSEGIFFETINAAGVLQVPMIMSVWDDEYGISVHASHQTTKENISEILKGFQRDDNNSGYEIFIVNGWDYPTLLEVYHNASNLSRTQHIPVLIHVKELTQPQGHSTSGSHERYKSSERLLWEKDFDCITQMVNWMIKNSIATIEEIEEINQESKKEVLDAKKKAWNDYLNPILKEQKEVLEILISIGITDETILNKFKQKEPSRKDIYSEARKVLWSISNNTNKNLLSNYIQAKREEIQPKYSSHLYSETSQNIKNIKKIDPIYANNENVDARIVLRDNFDALFNKYPEFLIFGEDTGNIGDVNQGLEGMQEKYGLDRVADVGIREASIIGQGIGLAMRGLRPIAEIQYLDYLLYAIQILSDDLATLQYRTHGKQKAPLIIRTRGHRLEGIWHSGSPMGMIVNALRGIHVLVPRNMTKAAGFYNALLQADEPALVIECLNGYRLKENLPSNLGEFTTPIGEIEIIKEGNDITVVSYGSTLRIVEQAAILLENYGVSCEVIDVQSLLPFDINHDILKSIQKTNQLIIIDEDVSSGASAYILQKIIEDQNAFQYLDAKPVTITAQDHRPAYGTDGDYYSKPSLEDIVEKIYAQIHDYNPTKFPAII